MSARQELERGRESFARRRSVDAFNALSLADEVVPLEAEDLELLSISAYLIGRDDDNLRALDRAYRAHLKSGETLRAGRAAFWLGFRLIDLGEVGRATGWLSRAGRLVEREERDCVDGVTCCFRSCSSTTVRGGLRDLVRQAR